MLVSEVTLHTEPWTHCLSLRRGWRWGFPEGRGAPPASLLAMTGELRGVSIRGGLRAKGWSPPGAFLLKIGKSAFLLEVQPSSRAKGPVRGVKSANVFAFPSALSLSAPMDPGFLILHPFPPSPSPFFLFLFLFLKQGLVQPSLASNLTM